jgi:acetone carboxylase alpha subunit
MLAQEFLSFVWPDLPRNQAVFAPISLRTDKRSTLHCSPDAPNAQSMMTFFPSFTAVQIGVPKFLPIAPGIAPPTSSPAGTT